MTQTDNLSITERNTMRIYIPAPEVNQNPDVPMIRVSTATNVCSTDAYTINVPSKDNRYVAALTWTLTDDECDLLLEQLAAARAERIQRQEQTYEALHAKFGGTWDNALATDDESDEDGE